ncbi:MAG: competence/damage-inducible protein A [Chloroflexota bacterium]
MPDRASDDALRAPSDREPVARPLATAELLAVGAELLVGDTRDTNSGDLATSLTELGVEVRRMTQLPDELTVVSDAVRSALRRVDLVITTGGLGPTPDDLTREAIAAALDEETRVDPDLEAWLRDIWARRRLPFSESNLKQAWLIPGATALPNPHGTAPGWWVEVGPQVLLALPGPPRELQPMWHDHALARLRSRGVGADRAAETLHLTGIGESALVDLIGASLLMATNPRIATYARADSVDVRISASGASDGSAREVVEHAIAALSPRLDAYVFARGDEGWPEALTDRLRGRTVATIESGTAGYLGLLLGAAPWLARSEHVRDDPASAAHLDAESLARALGEEAGTAVALAAVAYETDDDMRIEICVMIDGQQSRSSHSVFRGGDAGRRRAANAAAAELWRRLAD